jgi:hypothetical protein
LFGEASPRRALRQSSAQDFVHSATMSRRYIVMGLQFTVLVAIFLGAGVNLSFGQHPYDWHRSGSNNRDYEVGQDSQLMHEGKTSWPSSLYIKSIHPSPAGFGTLIQAIGADDYRGERLRMTGFVKTADIRGDGVGMWMRVDGKSGSSRVLSFYNMCDRPITGTTGWQKYEIILDVPRRVKIFFMVSCCMAQVKPGCKM